MKRWSIFISSNSSTLSAFASSAEGPGLQFHCGQDFFISLILGSQSSQVWYSVLSVHGLQVGMLPIFWGLFSGRFYQTLNLNLFMPIYHNFVTTTTAAYLVYYWTHLQKMHKDPELSITINGIELSSVKHEISVNWWDYRKTGAKVLRRIYICGEKKHLLYFVGEWHI